MFLYYAWRCSVSGVSLKIVTALKLQKTNKDDLMQSTSKEIAVFSPLGRIFIHNRLSLLWNYTRTVLITHEVYTHRWPDFKKASTE